MTDSRDKERGEGGAAASHAGPSGPSPNSANRGSNSTGEASHSSPNGSSGVAKSTSPHRSSGEGNATAVSPNSPKATGTTSASSPAVNGVAQANGTSSIEKIQACTPANPNGVSPSSGPQYKAAPSSAVIEYGASSQPNALEHIMNAPFQAAAGAAIGIAAMEAAGPAGRAVAGGYAIGKKAYDYVINAINPESEKEKNR